PPNPHHSPFPTRRSSDLGLNSGLGWPMHYRYPPLFLLLFAPFALLPLGLGAAVWVVLKVVVLIALMGSMVKRGLKPAIIGVVFIDRKSTRLISSHVSISY